MTFILRKETYICSQRVLSVVPHVEYTESTTEWTTAVSGWRAYGGNILLYNDYLPIHFRYVRCAKPDEIRDFCFAYGYRQREKEQHHL